MTWARRFRRREGVLESLLVIPLLGVAIGGILGFLVASADEDGVVDDEILWES